MILSLVFVLVTIAWRSEAQTDKERLLAQRDAITNWDQFAAANSIQGWDRFTDPCSGWTGITCAAGRISAFKWGTLASLSIDHQSLRGTLPGAWSGGFVGLRNLTLISLPLTGTLPDGWAAPGALQALEVLFINFNEIAGTLPATWAARGAFPRLRDLRLHVTKLTGPLPPQWGALNAFDNLGFLDLGYNELTGTIPAGWAAPGAWPNLRKLLLNNNRLTGSLPATWANRGPIQDLENAVLQDIEYMLFMGNMLTGTIPVAWGAPTAFLILKALNVTANPNLCGPVPGKLKGITYCGEALCAGTIQCANGSLSEPGWNFNPVYAAASAPPPPAVTLPQPSPSPLPVSSPPAAVVNPSPVPPSLSSPSVTGSSPDVDRLLAQKAAISNWDAFAADNGIAGWAQAMDACLWSGVRCDDGAIVSLDLSCTQQGSGRSSFCGTRAAGTLVPALAGISTLQTLAVSNQSLSGTLPPVWGQAGSGSRSLLAASDDGSFPALQYMSLDYNALTGPLPADWASASAFPALKTMDLRHNQLSGQLGAEWAAGKPYTLDLSDNPQLCASSTVASSVQVAQCEATPSPSSSSGSGSDIGVIVGAVVGVLAVVLAAAVTLVVVRRKRKRRALLEEDWMDKDEPGVPTELDSMVKAGPPPQRGGVETQPVQSPETPPALWVAPVVSGSQTSSPAVKVPGSDHAGSPAGSMAVSSFIATAAYGAAVGAAAGVVGRSAQRNMPGSAHGSVLRSRDNFDPQNDALLTWVQRQAPSVARAPSGLEGEAGLVDISLWKLNFFDLKIIQPLGEGSFGRVYLASYYETLVAAKILLSFDERELEEQAAANLLSLSSPILAALRKEASLLASLRHPNVVQFIGVATFPPTRITEFCSRGSLADVLRDARSSPDAARELTWPRRLAMALDAAVGVLYLHSRPHPIIHRDLKSPNLLVEDSWRVKVTDLNLSRLMEIANPTSKSLSLAALNPRWLAPEVMQGERAGPAADVFSFAVVLWEILTFDSPWGPNSIGSFNPWQLVGLVINGGRLGVPARECLPGIDTPHFQGLDEYVALIRRCWAQQPLDRPSFDHIAADLRSLLDRTVREMGT